MFVITTRTGLTSDLGRTLLGIESQRPCLRGDRRLSPCRDSVVCITATRSRPKPPAGSEGDLCLDPVRRALPLVLRVVTAVEDRTTQGRCDPRKEPSQAKRCCV